ncbi:hypothetical protein A2592_03010 [Candidatus Kaiserbacteria bacterium RIFOXYD1_FULL_42_15]|uniref:Peptidoglycan binding-like domain-containing protein n=1 Tax=Candidatus Kaiserbacteria bacterium RIFOXYD1_FULL_42_15 TaxID=1798532 RepID=A0A1F6FSI3_9BACT|nr:MAG: hypothetical protein A2592_03010 [Candidatus Kaiserbacteria bacterium RIFOXYD1_FULL_42_15]
MKKYFTKPKKISYFLLAISLLLAVFPLSSFASSSYTANSDLVIAGPYDTAISGSPANFGNSGNHSSIDILNIGHKYRIRQNGTISAARLYTVDKIGLTAFYITVYRLNGDTFTLIGQSENLVNQLVAGDFATANFSNPITGVREGDYYGIRVESRLAGQFNFYAKTDQTGVSAAYIYDLESSPISSDWTGGTYSLASGSVMPIELYMRAPQAVFIGDSIISGYYTHYSFLHTTEATNIGTTIEKHFGDLTSFTYQNMGIAGQTTAQIEARFTTDAVNLHPRIIIIEGGVNDIEQRVAKSTFIAKWRSMLDAAQASNSITTIMVMKILPWSNGTNEQMQMRDDWNASLVNLAAGYSKAIIVDTSSYIGQFRRGGDTGNYWDIQVAYNKDGVHFTQAGNAKIAQALKDALDTTTPVTADDTEVGLFSVIANDGMDTTTNRIVTLNLNASSDVKKMAISLTGDFNDARKESYSSTKQINLCSKFGGLTKDLTCAAGQYTVYVKFYTQSGKASDVVSTKINLINTSQSTKPVITTTKHLLLGPKNSQVKILQQFLNNNGFPLTNSGEGSIGNETDYFGQLTANALAKFQEANKDKVTGLIGEKGFLGPITNNFINLLITTNHSISAQPVISFSSSIFTSSLYKGEQSEDVRRLQTLLATKSEIYPDGLITGYFGQLTEKAVQTFQLKYGIVNSTFDSGYGIVGPKTRAKLQEVFGN